MERIARFEKISVKEFVKGYQSCFGGTEEEALCAYEGIVLPRRATVGSAGYDFFATKQLSVRAGETVKIPTGIRAIMEEGWVLALFPRSGLGFKYRLQLDNTVGIIDSDYCLSDNEGHIFIKITNDSKEGKTLELLCGGGFAQGIFLPFGVTEDDEACALRNGGFGSTGR